MWSFIQGQSLQDSRPLRCSFRHAGLRAACLSPFRSPGLSAVSTSKLALRPLCTASPPYVRLASITPPSAVFLSNSPPRGQSGICECRGVTWPAPPGDPHRIPEPHFPHLPTADSGQGLQGPRHRIHAGVEINNFTHSKCLINGRFVVMAAVVMIAPLCILLLWYLIWRAEPGSSER